MGKKFWLQFIINEALDVLTVYGTNADPAVATEISNAVTALKALIAKLTQS